MSQICKIVRDAANQVINVLVVDSVTGTVIATAIVPRYFSGIGAPSATTLAAVAVYNKYDRYTDTSVPSDYICTFAGTNATSTWKQISGGGGGVSLYNWGAYPPGSIVEVTQAVLDAAPYAYDDVINTTGFFVTLNGIAAADNSLSAQVLANAFVGTKNAPGLPKQNDWDFIALGTRPYDKYNWGMYPAGSIVYFDPYNTSDLTANPGITLNGNINIPGIYATFTKVGAADTTNNAAIAGGAAIGAKNVPGFPGQQPFGLDLAAGWQLIGFIKPIKIPVCTLNNDGTTSIQNYLFSGYGPVP